MVINILAFHPSHIPSGISSNSSIDLPWVHSCIYNVFACCRFLHYRDLGDARQQEVRVQRVNVDVGPQRPHGGLTAQVLNLRPGPSFCALRQ